jgi:agmatine/peptidylarginine deiminase
MIRTTRGPTILILSTLCTLLAGMVAWLLATTDPIAVGEVDSQSEQSLFYRPTAPAKLARIITETDPVDVLVVAMPEQQVLGNVKKEQFFVRLLELATEYVNVVVFINKNEHDARIKIADLLSKYATHPEKVRERVEFFPAQVDTEWIRDYSPIFALAPKGEPVLLDGIYRDIRSEAQTMRSFNSLSSSFIREAVGIPDAEADRDDASMRATAREDKPTYLSDYGTFWRRNDDAAPLYFNQWFYTRHFEFARMIRTPVQLWGGDALFDNDGRLFTSTETLVLNGGEERTFRKWVKDYYSVREIVYLRPLPNSFWHIDMFFKVGESNVLLLGEFETNVTYESHYLADLHNEAMNRMRWNRKAITLKCPSARIIAVPMPRISIASVAQASEGGATEAELEVKSSEGSTVQGKRYLTVSYRSFLNSVFLRGGVGGVSAVLIPTYSGLDGMEAKVGEVYAQAFPGARLHFVNCDAMNDEFGGIHCVTATIPRFRPVHGN